MTAAPSKGLVVSLTAGMIVFVILAEVFTWLSNRKKERERPERDRQLAQLAADAAIKKMEDRQAGAEKLGRSNVFDSAEGLERTRHPEVYLRIRTEQDGPYTKTNFALSNGGSEVAQRVRVAPYRLRSGTIDFTGIDILEPNLTKEIQPIVGRTSPLSRNNLSSLLFGEWDRLKVRAEEWALPMRILYEDAARNKFETNFLLVYLPMQDILEQAAFKAQDFKFRRLE